MTGGAGVWRGAASPRGGPEGSLGRARTQASEGRGRHETSGVAERPRPGIVTETTHKSTGVLPRDAGGMPLQDEGLGLFKVEMSSPTSKVQEGVRMWLRSVFTTEIAQTRPRRPWGPRNETLKMKNGRVLHLIRSAEATGVKRPQRRVTRLRDQGSASPSSLGPPAPAPGGGRGARSSEPEGKGPRVTQTPGVFRGYFRSQEAVV